MTIHRNLIAAARTAVPASACGPRGQGRYANEFHTTVKTACTLA